MNIGILGDPNGWHTLRLHEAALARGHLAPLFDFRGLASDLESAPGVLWSRNAPYSPPLLPDAVLIRTMPQGSLEQVIFRMDLLGRAHQQGVRLVNPPKSLEVCIDKFLTTALCRDAGIAVPRTMVFQDSHQAIDGLERLGGDVIVKPLFGSEGRGMVRISDPDTGWRVFSAIERMGQVIYLQEFINHPGWDLRVLVLGEKILGGMKRDGRGHWRTNISQGGAAEAVSVPDQAAFMALAASKVTNVIFGGIDLLLDPNGNWKLIEVNGVPGFRAFSKTTGKDIATKVIQHIEGESW